MPEEINKKEPVKKSPNKKVKSDETSTTQKPKAIKNAKSSRTIVRQVLWGVNKDGAEALITAVNADSLKKLRKLTGGLSDSTEGYEKYEYLELWDRASGHIRTFTIGKPEERKAYLKKKIEDINKAKASKAKENTKEEEKDTNESETPKA